jgi:hypothetical protein
MPRLTFDDELDLLKQIDEQFSGVRVSLGFTCPCCKQPCPDNEYHTYGRHEDCTYIVRLPATNTCTRAEIPLRVGR